VSPGDGGSVVLGSPQQLGRFWEPGKRVLGAEAGRPQRNRRIGWQHLHVAIDDHSRLAYAELLPARDAESCASFLARAVAWYAEQGVAVERVLTNNGKAYHARAWLERAHELGIACRYTRIYRPRTNGKAERFIQTLLTEWAYLTPAWSGQLEDAGRAQLLLASPPDPNLDYFE
jgi:transposase InsO family protein